MSSLHFATVHGNAHEIFLAATCSLMLLLTRSKDEVASTVLFLYHEQKEFLCDYKMAWGGAVRSMIPVTLLVGKTKARFEKRLSSRVNKAWSKLQKKSVLHLQYDGAVLFSLLNATETGLREVCCRLLE